MNACAQSHSDTRFGAVVSVLVIDDHPLFCDAMAMTVQQGLGSRSISTANSVSNAIEQIQNGINFDLVILDLNLPDVDGVDGLIRVKNILPRTPVVVVSSLSDNHVISAVMAAGAAGFVAKDSKRDNLVAALQQVLAGQVFTPESYSAHAGQTTNDVTIIQRMRDLTPQQATILQMICVGKLNKQIAFDLNIAETTVKAHITAILRKLDVRSRTQAAMMAQKVNFNTLLHKSKILET